MPSSGSITILPTEGDTKTYALALVDGSNKAFAWKNEDDSTAPTWTQGTEDGKTTYIAKFAKAKGWVAGTGNDANMLTYQDKTTAEFKLSSPAFDESINKDSIGNSVSFDGTTDVNAPTFTISSTLGTKTVTVEKAEDFNLSLESIELQDTDSNQSNYITPTGWSGDSDDGFTYALAHGSTAGYKRTDASGTTTLEYYPAESDVQILTLTGLPETVVTTATDPKPEGQVVINTTNAAVSGNATDGYTLTLGANILNAAADYQKTQEAAGKIIVAPMTGKNYTVAIAIADDANVATNKADASRNDAILNQNPGAETHTYTSTGYNAYFEAGKAEGVTDGENTVITVNPDQGGKQFTISGLKDSATKDGITFDDTNKNESGNTYYTFTFDPTILDEKDVIVTPLDNASTPITGEISGTAGEDYPDGKTPITAKVYDVKKTETDLENYGATFRAAGFQAGYISVSELTEENKAEGKFGEGIHTPTDEEGAGTTVLVYAGQRHGETLEIEGLSKTAYEALVKEDYSVPEAQDGSITLTTGIVISKDNEGNLTITLSEAALAGYDVILTNKTEASEYEQTTAAEMDEDGAETTPATYAYDEYTLALAEDVTNVVTVDEFTTEESTTAADYTTAYHTALTAAVKADTYDENQQKGVYHAMTFKDKKDESDTQDAKSAKYTYTSQYNEAFYTAIPAYDNKVTDAETLTDAGIMAAEGTYRYAHYAKGEYMPQTNLVISGLKTGLSASDIEDGSGDSVNEQAKITVTYDEERTDDDQLKGTVTINSKDALPDAADRTQGEIIGLSNEDGSTTNFTLAFGTALTSHTLTVEGTATHNDNYSMVDEIEYTVTEDQTTPGTYTITKSGTTAGYEYDEDTKTYVYKAQDHCEQFTVTGLKTKLTKTDIPDDMIEYDEASGTWKFTPTDDLIADDIADQSTVVLTYTGQVTRGNDTDGTTPYVDESGNYTLDNSTVSNTKVAIDGSGLAKNDAPEGWSAKTEDGKTTFTFTTARTADEWTATSAAEGATLSNFDTLTFAAGQGGDVLITLSGLADGTDADDLTDVTPTPYVQGTDSNGNATYDELVQIGTDNDAKWYKKSECTQGADGTWTKGDTATEQQFTGYWVNLPESVLDDSNTITYTKGTDSTGKYSTVILKFKNIVPNEDNDVDPSANAPTLDLTDATKGTYNYTSIYTPEQYTTNTDNDGNTTYTHVDESGKTTFTISGLKVATQDQSVQAPTAGDKVTGGTEPSGDVIVDYTTDGKITVTLKASAFPAEPTEGDTIQVTDYSDNDDDDSNNRTVTLTFDSNGAGKQGDNDYQLSDDINFSVTESDGTYTITLGGHTAGYYEEAAGSGVYKYREQSGGQQFTISGLKTGLANNDGALSTEEKVKALLTEENGTWTFKPTKAILADNYTADNQITFTYSGTVTALEAGNQLPSSLTIAQDDTTKVALDITGINDSQPVPEGWTYGDTTYTTTTNVPGSTAYFTVTAWIYKTTQSDAAWGTPTADDTTHTASTTYVPPTGGEELIVLTDLKSDADMPALTPYVLDSTDNKTPIALVSVTTGEGANAKTAWYNPNDVEDGILIDDDAKEVTTFAGYLVNLTDDLVEGKTQLTYKPGKVNDSKYKDATITLLFNGAPANTEQQETPLAFEQAKDDNDQPIAGKYTYTSKYTPNQYISAESKEYLDGVIEYTHVPGTSKTTFTIEGLASNVTNVTEVAADAETATYSGAVNVDYKSKQIVLTASALPTEHTEDNATIKVTDYSDGDDDSTNNLKLTFDDSISKHDDNDGDYVMSDEFEYTVTEGEGDKAGEYTVTFAGNTAGYEYNKDAGTYTYKAQTGGERFTISGLASGLTKDDITKGMFTFTPATGDGQDATPATYTFQPTAALLDKDSKSITLTYNGTVTKLANGENGAGTLTGAHVDSTDTTTQVEFDTSVIDNGTFTAAGWHKADNKGTFVYKTAQTAEAWAGGEAAATTSTLTFTPSRGGEVIVELSGLKSDVTANTLNNNAKLTYTDGEGNALNLVDIGNNQLYNTSDVEGNDSKGYTVKQNEYGTDAHSNVTPNAVTLNLTDSVIDRTAMQNEKTPVNVNLYNSGITVTFNDKPTVSNPPAGEAATLKALTGEGNEGKYTYTSAKTEEYYLSKTDADTGATSYTYTPATQGTLTFTISGLPEDLDKDGKGITAFSDYFTVATTTDAENNITGATVTLGTGAANTTLFETDKATTGVFALSDIKIDDAAATGDYKLALPEDSTTAGLITADHNVDSTADNRGKASLKTTDEGKTYTYTSTKYTGYLTVAADGKSIDFNASRGGEELFTVEGLKYTSGTDDLLAGDTVEVDDDAKTIVLRDGALAKTGDITIKATSTEVEGETVTGEAYDMKLFDQAAYDAGLAAAKADAVAALEPEEGTDAVTDEQKNEAETVAATGYEIANKDSIVKTEAVPDKAVFDAENKTFTPGYTSAYFTDDGKTSGTQTITFHEATGYGDTIKITGLVDNLTYSKITEGKDGNGNTTFTVANGSKTLFVVTYVKASDNGTQEHYIVAPTNDALKAGEKSYSIDVTAVNATDDSTRTLGTSNWDGKNLVEAKNVIAKAVGTKDGDGYTYTITLSGKTAGFTVNEKGELTSETATGQETFKIGGLKSGLKAAFLDKDGRSTNAATYKDENGEIKNNTFVGLKDSTGKVVVSFGNYDDYINQTVEDGGTPKAITDYSTSAGKVRISAAALADGATAVTFTPDSGKTFSFDGFVTGERVLTGDNANGICETKPESAYVFSETKNNDGTSNYVFEDKHLPAYFTAGTADGETGTTTYTYHKADTDFETFTLKNLKSGLTVSEVDVDVENSAKAVSITLPKDAVADDPKTEENETKAAVAGAVVLNTDAMPESDDAKTISVSDNKNSYALSLNEAVNTNKYKLADQGNATFETDEESENKYTYTAPKYTAYYTPNETANTIAYTPARGGDSFVIAGLKTDITGTPVTEEQAKDGTKHVGELTFTDDIITVTEDGNVTLKRGALPDADEMKQDYTINFTSDDDNAVPFTLSFSGINTTSDNGAAAILTDGKDGDKLTGTVTYTSKITSHEYLAKASTATKGYDETYTYHPQVGGYVITISNLSTTAAAKLGTNIKVADPTYNTDGTLNTAGKVTLYAPILQASLNEGTKISISLGTTTGNAANVKKAGDYQLALDTGASTKAVTSQDKYGSFKYSSGTYTFTASGNTAGYTVDDADQDGANSISYKAASGETTFTITGLKTGLAYTGTAAKGVEAQLKTKGITIGDALNGEVTVTLDATSLLTTDGTKITLTDGKADDGVTYKLALDNSLPTNKSAAETAGAIKVTNVSGTTATVTTSHTTAYYEEVNSNSYTYHAPTASKTFTITGLASGKTVDDLNNALSFTETANATDATKKDVKITVSDTSIFGTTGTIKAGALSGYNISFNYTAPDNPGDGYIPLAEHAVEKEGSWAVEAGTATYKSGDKAAFYSVSSADSFTEVKYVGTVAGAEYFALSGLSATANDSISAGVAYDPEDKVVTITTDKDTAVADSKAGLTITKNADSYGVVLNSAVKLTGTTAADTVSVVAAGATFFGLAGNDVIDILESGTVDAGAGNDSITIGAATSVDAGLGNDLISLKDSTTAATLNFSGGQDIINYSTGLVITGLNNYSYAFDNLESGAVGTNGNIEAGKGDLVLTSGTNKLTIVGGAGQAVKFVDSDNSQTSVNFNKALGDMLTFSGKTGVTLNGSNVTSPKLPYYGNSVGSAEYAVNDAQDDIVTINASQYDTSENGLTIQGTAKNNVITGSKYADSINPVANSTPSLTADTVTGGAGNDIIVYNGGKLTITDFNLNGTTDKPEVDVLQLGGNKNISTTAISGNNIVFGVANNESITLTNAFKNSSVTSVKIVNEAGESVSNYTYHKDGHIVSEDGTAVTLTSGYTKSSFELAEGSEIGHIDATALTKAIKIDASGFENPKYQENGVTIEGGSKGGTIIGSGYNDSIVGSSDSTVAELFVFTGGGDDTVNNFDAKDAVSLASEGYVESIADIETIKITAAVASQPAVKDDPNTEEDETKAAVAAEEGTLEIGFNSDYGKLKLTSMGIKDSVKINNVAYFVGDNVLMDKAKDDATKVTLTSGFSDTYNAGAKVATIDASHVTGASDDDSDDESENAFGINANGLNNLILAAGDGIINKITVGGGKDTVELYKGEDVTGSTAEIVYQAGKDNTLTIKNLVGVGGEGTRIKLVSADESTTLTKENVQASIKGDDVIFTITDKDSKGNTVKGGTITVVGALKDAEDGTIITLLNNDEEDDLISAYTYYKDRIENEDFTSVTLTSAVSGSVFAGTEEDSVVGSRTSVMAVNVDASNASKVTFIQAGDEAGTIVGNAGNNSIIGGKGADSLVGAGGNDTLYGGETEKGNDTLEGGAGNDVFYFDGKTVEIADYSATGSLGADKIFVDGSKWSLAGYAIDSDDDNKLTLNYGNGSDNASIIVDKGADMLLSFTDGKKTTTEYYSKTGVINTNNPLTATSITLAAAQSSFNAQDNFSKYPRLASIDSGAVSVESGQTSTIAISGNSLNNYIDNSENTNAATLFGGAGNDTLLAGSGGGSLAGGVGNDLFILSTEEGTDAILVGDYGTLTTAGNDTIRNFDGTKDTLVTDTNVDFMDATINGANLTLSFKGTDSTDTKTYNKSVGNVVLASVVSSGSAEVGIDSTLYTFNSDGKIKVGIDELRVTSAYKGKSIGSADDNTVTKIDASANKSGVSIYGGTATTELIGGTGADSIVASSSATASVTGGKGNDIFVYSGGALTITDFGDGTDKVSLAGEGNASLSMKDLSGVEFQKVDGNDKAADIALTFGEDNTNVLTLRVADSVKATAFNFMDGDTLDGAGKGKVYKFVDNGVAIGNSLTLLSGGDVIDISETGSLQSYTSVTADYEDATIKGQTGKSNNITLNKGKGSNGSSVVGGNLADTLTANAAVTLTGGKGNDKFIIKATGATITDYSSGGTNGTDTISIDGALGSFSGYEIDKESGVKLTYTLKSGDDVTSNEVSVIGGAKDGVKLNLVEDKTNIVRKFSTVGSFNNNDTAVTLAANTTGGFDAATYNTTNSTRIASINSAAVEAANVEVKAASIASFLNNDGNANNSVKLTGGQANDTLIAGTQGDIMNGGKGNDTLVGGDDADTFVIGLDSDEGKGSITAGNDVIVNFGEGDKLTLQEGVVLADAAIRTNQTVNEFDPTTGRLVASKTKGNLLVLTFNYADTGKVADVVTLQGVAWNNGDSTKGASVTIGNSTYTVYADGKIATSDAITLTSAYTQRTFEDTLGTDGAAYSSIYAGGNTRGISITGGDDSKANVNITGSKGADLIKTNAATPNDAEFTGGAGNDTFAYGGGTVTVKDFSTSGSLGSDRITLASGFAMGTSLKSDAPKTLTAVEVTDGDTEDTIKLTFDSDNELSLNVADVTKTTVTIADDQVTQAGGAGTRGTAYTFRDGVYGIGKAATVLSSNDTFGKDNGVDGTTYSSVTGGKVTLDGSEATAAMRLTLTDEGKAVGGKGADSLVGTKGGTFTGGAGVDTFVIAGAGNYVITDYYTGADKISLGANIGTLTDVESINGGVGYKLTFSEGTDTTTLTLNDIQGNTPIILITTTEYTNAAKTTTRATTATLYAAEHAVYDRASLDASKDVVYTNATKVTLTTAEADGDFGGVTGTVADYNSMNSITAYGGGTIYGNKNANTITIDKDATVKGGLGADTYIINGGDVTISDFGIGATTIFKEDSSTGDSERVTLASAITGKGYDYEDPTTYAPGSDTLRINGKILSVEIDNIDTAAAAKADEYKGDGFTVTLYVDYDHNGKADGTITLENVLRNQVSIGSADNYTVTNQNASSVDLNALKIYDKNSSTATTYTSIAWGNGRGSLASLLGEEYETDTTNGGNPSGGGRAALDYVMGETPAGYSNSGNNNGTFGGNTSGDAQLAGTSSGSASSNRTNH